MAEDEKGQKNELDLAAAIEKLTEHAEAMERRNAEVNAKAVAAAAAPPTRRDATVAARSKMRTYHEERRADPTKPRTRTPARGEAIEPKGDDDGEA